MDQSLITKKVYRATIAAVLSIYRWFIHLYTSFIFFSVNFF